MFSPLDNILHYSTSNCKKKISTNFDNRNFVLVGEIIKSLTNIQTKRQASNHKRKEASRNAESNNSNQK